MKFAPIHLAVVGFMIKPAKMQHAMKNKLLDLALKRKAIFAGLFLGLLGRDNNVAKIVFVRIEFVGLMRE